MDRDPDATVDGDLLGSEAGADAPGDAIRDKVSSGDAPLDEGPGLDKAPPQDKAIPPDTLLPPVSCNGLSGGTHSGTQTSGGRVRLSNSSFLGYYTSKICDAKYVASWTTLKPVPAGAYGKPLLSSSESGYADINANATGLVGLWHLDGNAGALGSGVKIADSSIKNHHGTTSNANNTGLALVAGKLGEALSCDGVDDYVEVPASVALKGFNTVTVQAWARASYSGNPPKYGRFVTLWESGDTLGSTFMLGHFTSGNAGFMAVPKVGPTADVFWPWLQTAGKWYHMVGVYDGTRVRLYINGAVYPDPQTSSGALQDRTGSLFFCQGGSSSPSPTYVFSGALDEIAIWKRALSADEIHGLQSRGAATLRYQVRACGTSTCNGVSFVGPDGTTSSYYSEAESNTPGPPVFKLTSIKSGRYFQWRAYFQRDNNKVDPQLVGISATAEVP